MAHSRSNSDSLKLGDPLTFADHLEEVAQALRNGSATLTEGQVRLESEEVDDFVTAELRGPRKRVVYVRLTASLD